MAEPVKLTRACNTPGQATVGEPVKLTQECAYIHRRGRSKRSQAQSCDTAVWTHTPKEHGQGEIIRRAQIQNSRITRAKIGEHGHVPWPYTISSSRGKKTVVPASKKKKGLSSSSVPTSKVRHPFLRFPIEPQEELFQILRAQPLISGRCIDCDAIEQVQLADVIRALLTTDPWELFFGIIEPTYLELTMELCSTFHLQTVMMNYDDPGMASALPLSLRYLHTFFAHTITGRQGSTGAVNTLDAYFLWCMSHGHVIDLAYFIALAIQHQTERHRKGVISIGPYVTRFARHFGFLITAAQESSLTLIGQMSP
ncbi:hypothetical protein GOBAR_AA30077 [Gossypium barbadense]|uniref:Uncharacterized protein n=1 Tax=Gossypium barbadense TaxID=3634 RepID=A0A2P5WHP1_GOSBA|nr:hypothetical protein GOBAR_AA30077 [Gossypium barbadense]